MLALPHLPPEDPEIGLRFGKTFYCERVIFLFANVFLGRAPPPIGPHSPCA